MSDPIRVALLPADEGGCGLHRIINPGRVVQNMDDSGVSVFYGKGLTVKFDWQRNVVEVPPIHADVVVLQRPMDIETVQAIPMIQAQGVAVVCELDDDIELTDPENRAYPAVHPASSPRTNWAYLKQAMALADLVTVSTPALTRYAPHGRVRVIPNFVPRWLLELGEKKEPTDRVAVGWTGTVDTHPKDLYEPGWGVARALEETGAPFHIVGDGLHVKERLGLLDEPEVLGWVPIRDYPAQLRDAFEIGIVPLDRTRFNDAKSALKGLEMGALGIPYVATPTAEYRRIFEQDGIGVLAKKPRDWRIALMNLIKDESYRNEVRERTLVGIRSRHVLEDHAWLWAEAWADALTVRRTSREVVTT